MCRNIVSLYHDEAKKVVEGATIFYFSKCNFVLMFSVILNKKSNYVFIFRNIFIFHFPILFLTHNQ